MEEHPSGKENWVLGREDAGLTIREIAQVEVELRERYTQEYVSVWKDLLADLQLAPMTSEARAMETLSLVTAQPSVLKKLLEVVAENTALSEVSEGEKEEEGCPHCCFGEGERDCGGIRIP